jgi:hypothetical protein
MDFYLLLRRGYVTCVTVKSDIVHILLRRQKRKMELAGSMVRGCESGTRYDGSAGEF